MLIKYAQIYDAVHPQPYVGDVLINGTRIQAIGPQLSVPGEEELDAQGLRLYPGFIDAHSHLGLDNYGMGFEGHDYNEMGDIVAAHLRGIDSFNPLELGVRRALEGGVTTVGHHRGHRPGERQRAGGHLPGRQDLGQLCGRHGAPGPGSYEVRLW